MKKYLLLSLILFLLIPNIGCNQNPTSSITDKPLLTEAQAINYAYEYVMNQAGKSLLSVSAGRQIMDSMQLKNTLNNDSLKFLNEADIRNLGKSTELYLGRNISNKHCVINIATWTGFLKKIAKYQGSGIWAINLGNEEYYVIEKSKEVVAINDSAIARIEKYSHDVYKNKTFNYEISYPAGWLVVEQQDKPGYVTFKALDSAERISLTILQPTQDITLSNLVSMTTSEASSMYTFYNLIGSTKLDNGDYMLEWECQLADIWIYNRDYFLLRNNLIFGINESIPKNLTFMYLKELENTYNSFKLN